MAASLTITIDSAGLNAIYGAGQSVTLALQIKQMVVSAAATKRAAEIPLTVGWQSFSPLQTNTVTWNGQFYGFTTTTPLQMGAVITMNTQTSVPMQPGAVYTFANGQFSAGSPAGSGAYIVENKMSAMFAFGLAEQATVNGVQTLAPANAAYVLQNQAAYFTPSNTVSIFLSSATQSGTLMPAPINPLTVAVDSSPVAVGFNDQTNNFFQLS